LDGANPADYEVDHLIPLDLGGSNDITNLWPQPRKAQDWTADKKDRLEHVLGHEVCEHKVPLEVAQQEISQDWTAAYTKHVEAPAEPPLKKVQVAKNKVHSTSHFVNGYYRKDGTYVHPHTAANPGHSTKHKKRTKHAA
jgi:hypothetical protein